jgi:transposase-like protein
MPGKTHSDEIRAETVGMVLSGMSIAEAARAKGIDKSVVSRWISAHNQGAIRRYAPRLRTRARDPVVLEALIFDYVADLLTALRAQLQITTQQSWLAKQNAGDVALLLGTETDRLVRLLAGFRPIEAAADGPGQTLTLEPTAPPDSPSH